MWRSIYAATTGDARIEDWNAARISTKRISLDEQPIFIEVFS